MVALPDRDRGQVVLVGAVVVAIAIVALVVVLNTVLYTANVTTTGGVASGEAAVEYQQLVDRTLPRSLRHANLEDTHASPAAARASLQRLLAETSRTVQLAGAANTSATTYLDPTSTTVGTLAVDQNRTDGFVNAGDDGNWTVVPQGVSSPLNVTLTLDADSLPSNTNDEHSFTVVADDGTETEVLTFSYAGASDNLFLRVDGGRSYKLGQGNVTIDLVSGRVVASESRSGSNASSFDGIGDLTEPRISVEHGENASGTYRALFDDTGIHDGGHTAPYHNASTSVASPFLTYVVRDVDVTSTYASPELVQSSSFSAALAPATAVTHVGPLYLVRWVTGDVRPNGYGAPVTLNATADVPQADLRLQYGESNASVANVTAESGRTAATGADLVDVDLGAEGHSHLTVTGADDRDRVTVTNYLVSDFEDGALDPDWNTTTTSHVSMYESGTVARSGDWSVELGGSGSDMYVASKPLDTADASTLLVDVWARAGRAGGGDTSGPEADEPNEHLVVEFQTPSGNWVEVGHLDAIDTDTENPGVARRQRIEVTDPRAQYVGVQFRLRMPEGDLDDDHWYIDDLRITGVEDEE